MCNLSLDKVRLLFKCGFIHDFTVCDAGVKCNIMASLQCDASC